MLITIDTLRYDRVGCYSQKYLKTPQIDKVASKSFVFVNAFAHNPLTLPSHVNILTGTTPLYHGIGDNSGFKLDDRFLTISEFLKEEGYQTAAFIGAFPLDSRFGLTQGFDVYDDNYGTHNNLDLFFVERNAKKVITPAIKWISKVSGKWFSWIHLFDPHQPYLPPAPFDKKFAHDLYSGEVAYLDQQLGVLFDYLEKNNLFEKTIVVITSDHGEALGEKGEETHGYFAYNNTIHIPLIVFLPGQKPGIIEENVCHADIFPTICDSLGYKIPSHIQGESLLPFMEGEKRKNKKIYFESLTPYINRGWAPLRGFIQDNIKFIDLPIKEVYNIQNDINEEKNLAKQSDVRRLKSDLFRLRKGLEGKFKTPRSSRIDSDVRNKLKTLGYLTGTPGKKKKVFTEKDDLKTLLPLQNRMHKALSKYQKGNVSQAIKELRSIVEINSSFILVYRHIATIYKDTGREKEAIAVLKAGLKKNPDNVNLMSKLGIMLAETGQTDEAITLLEYCLKKDVYDPEIYNFLGVSYFKKGRFKLALDNYDKVLELDHNYAPVYNNIGTVYLVLYQRNKRERAYNLAMASFNNALKIDARLYSALNGRGSAYFFKDKIVEAIKDWKKAIAVRPKFSEPYFNIGIAYLKKGDKKSALKFLKLGKDRLYSNLPENEKQRLDRLIREAQN
jgi:arylsulfatase A-like enzyme/Flp pilus assembly protein TadD